MAPTGVQIQYSIKDRKTKLPICLQELILDIKDGNIPVNELLSCPLLQNQNSD